MFFSQNQPLKSQLVRFSWISWIFLRRECRGISSRFRNLPRYEGFWRLLSNLCLRTKEAMMDRKKNILNTKFGRRLRTFMNNSEHVRPKNLLSLFQECPRLSKLKTHHLTLSRKFFIQSQSHNTLHFLNATLFLASSVLLQLRSVKKRKTGHFWG